MSSPDDLSDLVQRLRHDADPGRPRIPEPELRRRPANRIRKRRRLAWISAATAVLLCAGTATAVAVASGGDDKPNVAAPAKTQSPAKTKAPAATPTPTPTSTPTPEPTKKPKPKPAEKWDIDTPESFQVVVNKQRPFEPRDWIPGDLVDTPAGITNTWGEPLRAEAAEQVQLMFDDASAAGVPFNIRSGYRSYETQVGLFNNYVNTDGVEAAETYSARPGYSEHQTGLVVDFSECEACDLSEAFGEMPEGIWLRDNAHRFGFVMRYQQEQDAITGYTYEPWHFRYVGVDVATEMFENGTRTLEEFFDLEPAPDYDPSAREE